MHESNGRSERHHFNGAISRIHQDDFDNDQAPEFPPGRNPRPSLREGDYLYHDKLGEVRVLDVDRSDKKEYRLTVRDHDEKDHEHLPCTEFEIVGGHARISLFETDGCWHKSNPALGLLGSPQQACLIDFLANWQATRGCKREWFYCCNKDIVLRAYIPPSTIDWLFKELKRKGYISTKVQGWGRDRKRWIHLHYDKIWSDVQARMAEWNSRYGSP